MSAKLKGRTTNPAAIVAAAAARRGVPPSALTREKARVRWTGAGNPNWKDGRAAARYASGYGRRVRKQVIERDRVCVTCGKWDERPRAMHLHHLDGRTDNHDLANLVLLCRGCHFAGHKAQRHAGRPLSQNLP